MVELFHVPNTADLELRLATVPTVFLPRTALPPLVVVNNNSLGVWLFCAVKVRAMLKSTLVFLFAPAGAAFVWDRHVNIFTVLVECDQIERMCVSLAMPPLRRTLFANDVDTIVSHIVEAARVAANIAILTAALNSWVVGGLLCWHASKSWKLGGLGRRGLGCRFLALIRSDDHVRTLCKDQMGPFAEVHRGALGLLFEGRWVVLRCIRDTVMNNSIHASSWTEALPVD
jgi:hypothetical protein